MDLLQSSSIAQNGCRDILQLSEWVEPLPKIPFSQNGPGVSSPVCGEHVHTGRPHTRTNKSVKNPM